MGWEQEVRKLQAELLYTGTSSPRGQELVQVSDSWGVKADIWAALDRYQRDKLAVTAVARQTRKSVVVGRSAARIWGLPTDRDHKNQTEAVELAHVTGAHAPGRNQCDRAAELGTGLCRAAPVIHHTWKIDEQHILDACGVRVTSPVRTAVDVARKNSIIEGITVMDALLRIAMIEHRRPQEGLAIAREAMESVLVTKRLRGIRQGDTATSSAIRRQKARWKTKRDTY